MGCRSRALIDLHGGTLEINSEKGVGTEVAIVLPSRHTVLVNEARDVLLGRGTNTL